MYRSDWHMHTMASYDAKTRIRDILAAAEQQGMTDFGMTDHVNIPSWFHYLQESRALFDAHKRPGFHFGVELTTISGYQEEYDRKNGNILGYKNPEGVHPVALPLTEEELRSVQVEYVVGAAHWVLAPCKNIHDVIADFHRQQMMLANDPRVDIVGHPFCITGKYTDDDGNVTCFDDFALVPRHMIEEFFDALLKNGKCMEINRCFMNGAAYTEKLRRGYMEFVKEAFDRGIPITYGSDNHGPGYPDAQALVEEYLGKVGFKSENFSMPKFRTY